MSIDNMSEAELNDALQSEIQALNGGINPDNEFQTDNSTYSEEYEDNQTSEDDTTDDNQEDEIEENKTEKKIKKLLSQRNEEKREKLSLVERLSEMENKLADTEFYKDNQDAAQYKDDITKLVKERWFTRDEAFLLIAWKQVLEQNKKLNSNKTSMIGNTPWINKNWTNPNNMNMSDLDNLVNNMYKAGKLTI